MMTSSTRPATSARRPPTAAPKPRMGVLLLVLGTAVFGAFAWQMRTATGLAAIDPDVHSWLVEHRTPWATALLEAVTTVSSPTWLTVLGIGFAALWAWRRRELWRPGLLMAAMAATVGVSWILKHLLARSRPATEQMLMGPDDAFSFPSGHTLGITVFLLSLAYLVLSRRSSTARRTVLVLSAVALIPTVALSRVYLGYHWPTDVLASIGLGVAMLGVVVLVDGAGSRWAASRRRNTASIPSPAPVR